MKKSLIYTLLLCGFISLNITACYGPFKLTKKLYKWNGNVEGKWPREAVFLILTIVPVYPFAVLGDAILFNSIEFWTGSNPIDTASLNGTQRKVLSRGSVKTILAYLPQQKVLDIAAFDDQAFVRSLRIEPLPAGGMALRSENGRLIMVSRTTEDGGVRVENAVGTPIVQYSAEQAEAILRQKSEKY